MIREKVEQVLEFGKTLKLKLAVVTEARRRIFIDFSYEAYKDVHIFNTYLYLWDTTFNHWNLVLLKDVKDIEVY